MHKRNAEQKDHYFRELAHNLRQEGFTVCPEEDWLLPVEMEGQPLCRATDSGGVRYWKEDADSESRCNAIERVTDIVRITDEYMSQMDAAPDLKVGSLSENYKLLAEFNGTVLAGHLTKYGAQFITWSRGYEQTSLQHGHYSLLPLPLSVFSRCPGGTEDGHRRTRAGTSAHRISARFWPVPRCGQAWE